MKEYLRHVEGADTVILFVHGILGAPNHFDPFLPLVPSHWSICNMLLKGHGGSVKDFSAASMDAWKAQVHKTLESLRKEYGRVVIVAHSMGTLFAIHEAIADPVEALFLMNVPLKVGVKPRLIKTCWRILRGKIPEDDKWTLAARQVYGVENDKNIFHYIGWIPRYFELFSEIRKTRKVVPMCTSHCQAYLSLQDEMVSPKSAKYLRENENITLQMLPASGHFYYDPADMAHLRAEFQEMIKRIERKS